MKILEEDPPLATESELPWLIDMLLYPISAAGMVNLAIFCLGPLLLGLVNRLVLSRIPFGTLIGFVLLLMLVAYALYYLAFCTFDSSKGGRRAPDTLAQDAPDKSDLVSQFFLILGSIALCFWPAVVYSAWTGRTDVIFWLLSALGLFFFPMALLAGVLFDAIHALNPIVIIASIVRRNLSRRWTFSPSSVSQAKRGTHVGGGALEAIIAPVPMDVPVMRRVLMAVLT